MNDPYPAEAGGARPGPGGLAVRADAPAVVELPPGHLELVWRPLTLADADALHVLLATIEDADDNISRTSAAGAREMLEGAWKDLSTDTLAGVDADGALRAYAMVEVRPGDERTVRAFLRGGVHPAWRSRGVGPAILAWMEGRGRQMLAASGKDVPGRLAVYVDEHQRDQRRLYAAAGFSPIRWYTQMRRDLADPVPPAPAPAGLQVVPWTEELDDAVRLAHNEAFLDHWGTEPQTPETWRNHQSGFVPSWSFVVLDPSGGDDASSSTPPTVAAYLLSGRYEQDWPVLGYSCGYTDLLGVRPAYRGRGIAVTLLAAAMRAYREDGMQYAALSVDTANPSGAHTLYERLGYERVSGEVLYSVEI
ncbi:GNAT family N-acetyltransferase [Actinotalea sp. Marseille-Q4924]|uniref:GNAT family N-acetyltransferase n=1 Tax=Actinotalea sp. Marseille-Q4924 TaxID=2866571 RepID=UPI001CE45F59|nr:GNAT family N-acetyltransferase [Actinotalea sp. Marseille-Q4924]